MAKLQDAKRLCPELVVVHVATYKEGEKQPGYWDNVDTRTHKVYSLCFTAPHNVHLSLQVGLLLSSQVL
jgi:hypothetical protein